MNQLGDANEVLHDRALVVMARMSNKLTGRDFSSGSNMSGPNSYIHHSLDHSNLISGDAREVEHGLSVKLQVQKLIIQAMSHENLCQNYVGYVCIILSSCTRICQLVLYLTSKFLLTNLFMPNLVYIHD